MTREDWAGGRAREATKSSIAFVTRVAVAYALLLGFVTVVVSATRDEVLFLRGAELPLPLFGISIEVRYFYFFAPILVFLFHAYLLLERLRLTDLICDQVREDRKVDGDSGGVAEEHNRDSTPSGETDALRSVFIPAFVSRGLVKASGPSEQRTMVNAMLWLVVIALTFLPPAVLLFIQLTFESTNRSWFTLLHRALLIADLLLLVVLLPKTYSAAECAPPERSQGAYTRRWIAVVVGLVLVFISFDLIPPFIQQRVPMPPRLLDRDSLILPRWSREDGSSSSRRPAPWNLEGVNLSDATLDRFDLHGLELRKANLSRASLVRADLAGTNLTEADLRYADLTGADLSEADLTAADLSGAILDSALLRGAKLRELTAHETSFFAADLAHADLAAADLRLADLRLTSLFGAWLDGSHMVEAKLDGSILPPLPPGVDLRGASLVSVLMPRDRDEFLRETERARDRSKGEEEADRVAVSSAELEATDLRLADLRDSAICSSSDPASDLQGAVTGVSSQEDRVKVASALRERLEDIEERLELKRAGELPHLAVARNRIAELNEPGRVDVPSPCTPREPDLDAAAHAIVLRACYDATLARDVIRRAAGEILPTAPRLEARLAEKVLRQSSNDDCPELHRLRENAPSRICPRWSGTPSVTALCSEPPRPASDLWFG